jgi:hypothetical protein
VFDRRRDNLAESPNPVVHYLARHASDVDLSEESGQRRASSACRAIEPATSRMLELVNDIRSLGLQAQHGRRVGPPPENWHPLVLTINGKAELVVQDADQALLDRREA